MKDQHMPVDQEKIDRIVGFLASESERHVVLGRAAWQPTLKDRHFKLAQWYLNGARTVCIAQAFDRRDCI